MRPALSCHSKPAIQALPSGPRLGPGVPVAAACCFAWPDPRCSAISCPPLPARDRTRVLQTVPEAAFIVLFIYLNVFIGAYIIGEQLLTAYLTNWRVGRPAAPRRPPAARPALPGRPPGHHETQAPPARASAH